MIDGSMLQIMKLTGDLLHLTKDFDCKDKDLNEFIQVDALKYGRGKLAVTYAVLYDRELVGYFCLSNDSISLNSEDKRKMDRLGKSQKNYPAIKIGRLGVSCARWGQGVGSFIIGNVVSKALEHSENMGCRYITVDAYNKEGALSFYSKNSFKPFSEKGEKPNKPMYLDIMPE